MAPTARTLERTETAEPFAIEVVTASGRAAAIELHFRPDEVEVWHAERRRGVFDRGALRDWLAEPGRPLVVDQCVFSLDRMVDQDGRVAVSLPGVDCWTIAPTTLDHLTKRL